MRYRYLLLGLAGWALAGEPLWAQNVGTGIEPVGAARGHQYGTRGANFLRIGPDPRARALGDAGTALVGGATVLYYNPGSAALAERFEVSATYSDLYAGSGLKHAYVGAILPVGVGAFGAHAIVFTSGEIQATTELSPDGFDPLLGDVVEWKAVALGVTYARRITDRLSLGLTGKYVQEGIAFAHVNFVGFDVGTVFDTGLHGARLGAAIANIGGDSRFEGPAIHGSIRRDLRPFNDQILGTDLLFRFETDDMEMPMVLRFGIEIPLMGTPEAVFGPNGRGHTVHMLTEVNDGTDADIESRFGFEYSYRDMLFLRAGKHFRNEDQAPWNFSDGLSGGLGLRLPFLGDRRIGLDYAYTNMGILDNVQTFAIQIGS